MLDPNVPSVVQRMVNVNDLLLHAYDERCLDASYNRMIDGLRDTSWSSPESVVGGRQWTYQTCVEFGFFQSSDDTQQPFGNRFPASYENKPKI